VGQSPVVLGLDFGGTKIAMAVCEPSGDRLGAATVSSGGELGARASFDRGITASRDLLEEVAPGRELAAVGVSTFGIPFDNRVELAPAISGWDTLALGSELRAAFAGAQIRMATDAKAAAQAEARWGALAGCDPAVYLNLGTGLSAAIVLGGQVLGGANGAAGEIGYNLRAISDVGIALSSRVPLEDMVSGQPTSSWPPRTTLSSTPWSPSSLPSSPSTWSTSRSAWTRRGSPSAAAWSARGIVSSPACTAPSARASRSRPSLSSPATRPMPR
jgi:glucokinase